MPPVDPALFCDVDLLCLDAGNTVVFFDHTRVASLCGREGFVTTPEALLLAEAETKNALEQGTLFDSGWASPPNVLGAQGWAGYVGTMLSFAGLARRRVAYVLEAIWPEHRANNLWSIVPDGLVEALVALRALGVRVAIVSNSEGKLEAFFARLGILRGFDAVVDSGVIGAEKPDPRIFHSALSRFGIPPARALHLGDNYATDVLGARAVGMRVALVDPHGHLDGRHNDIPRVAGVREVAGAIADARRRAMGT